MLSTSCRLMLHVADAGGRYRPATDQEILHAAYGCLDRRFHRHGSIGGIADAKSLMALRLGGRDREVFAVLFLDSALRVIEFRELFRGTINQTSVYPREVVRAAMLCNAAAIVCAHNHPSSGNPEPSVADELLTLQLKQALKLVDVRLVDHLVVGGGRVVSFAERGLL